MRILEERKQTYTVYPDIFAEHLFVLLDIALRTLLNILENQLIDLQTLHVYRLMQSWIQALR